MTSHITIEGDNGQLALKPDTSLTITDRNPMFNDVEMFSLPIELPFELNRHMLKNMDDVNSDMRASDIDRGRFRIIVDGLPLRTAVLKTQEDTVLNGAIEVNFDAANRTFKDMIADMRCRDVEIDDKILIGEKIGDVEVKMHITEHVTAYFVFGDGYAKIYLPTKHITETFQPNALGFSFPGSCFQNSNMEAEPDPDKPTRIYQNPNVTVKNPKIKQSYINTSAPYGDVTNSPHKDKDGNTIGWPYCNSRISYAHHAAKYNEETKEWESSDDIMQVKDRQTGTEEDKSPYWVLPADRPASGLCFYVAYFLEKLFKHLGVAFDMSALQNITDFNYLAFFSTQCHYENGENIGVFTEDLESVNKWLESRGCGGSMSIGNTNPEPTGRYYTDVPYRRLKYANGEYERIEYYWKQPNNGTVDIRNEDGSIDLYSNWTKYSEKGRPYSFFGDDFTERGFDVTYEVSAKVLKMYANSDNFPDRSVSEVIDSLEKSFGVRFCYDAEQNKVTVKLLRDMFRDQQEPVNFNGTVLSMYKMTENVRGVRVGYSAESDAQEQRDNIRYGKRDYNTDYDYMDYPQGRTKLASYADVTERIDVGNRNGYCDLATGDFFRIKVSSEASTVDEMKPAVFEVGGLKSAEIGDCSVEAENDDAIKELTSGFEPIIVNDVAYVGKNYDMTEYKPLLVPFVDEDMQHEYITGKILNPVSTAWGSIDIIYNLCLGESYDPTSTDDGHSPLQTHDWGLTIGILRPGNTTSDIITYDEGYDGFGNAKWMLTSENFAVTSDSYDVLGNFLGTNPAGSFSLKPCAYKPFRYKYDSGNLLISTNQKEWDDPSWLIPCNNDERNGQGVITARRRSRGYYDTFLKEYVHFLLYRKKYEVKALCTAAELADIPNKWLRRWVIDGKTGYLNLLEYPVDMAKGIGEVRIEFFSI